MISFVSGIIEYVDEETVTIDNNGIGLSVFMPKDELASLGQGEEIKVFTFLDVKENLMNVAVSRAEDSFLVFGNINCLKDEETSPSGLLKKYILENKIERRYCKIKDTVSIRLYKKIAKSKSPLSSWKQGAVNEIKLKRLD